MRSLKFHLLLALVLVAHTILLSCPAFSDDYSDENHGTDTEIEHASTFDEDGLVQGLNSHRQGLKLSPIAKNVPAECIADEVSDLQLGDQPCGASASLVYEKAIPASSGEPFPNYQEVLLKCNVNANVTANWFILPVCVPKLDPKVVLSKYTQTLYGKLLSDPKFTGVGVNSVDNWVVAVLSTGTTVPPANATRGAIPPSSAAGTGAQHGSGGAAFSPQGSAAGPAPHGSPASAAVGMVSQMGSGVYLMALLLCVGLLFTS